MNKEDIMKPASLAWALPLALTLIWLLGMTQWPAGLWPWRHELLILTGLIGLGFVGVAATRRHEK